MRAPAGSVPDMSETFTKLFSSILHSSVWCEPPATKLVWITLLAMADKDGYVAASIPGIAAAAGVSLEEAETAIETFLSPDPYSRSKEHEGRRIEEVDRGYVLLNYQRFRDMRDEEARKEYERKRKRRQRAMSRTVPECPAVSAQAEAEADKSTPPTPPQGGDGSTAKGKTRPKVRAARPHDVSESVWRDFNAQRRSPFTQTALDGFQREAAKAGLSLEAALRMSTERGWQGFKASWVDERRGGRGNGIPSVHNTDNYLRPGFDDGVRSGKL